MGWPGLAAPHTSNTTPVKITTSYIPRLYHLWCAVILILGGQSAFAQWQLVDTGAVQNGVSYAKGNPTVAWSVGGSGYIRRSLDGGATWASQPSNTANALQGVDNFDATTVWVVGQSGTILKTTDSGVTWVPQTSGTGSQLNSVSVVNANTVWAVGNGGVIRKTINGGTNWTGQTSGTAQPLNDVFAVDTNVAWAVGSNGVILKTINGGTNWVAQTSGTAVSLFGVTAADANTAWAVGETGTLIKTTDGGTTWTPQTSGTISGLYSITAVNANVLWAVGDAGAILKTTNGGTTWISTVSGTTRQLFSVSAVDDLTSLSVGFFGTYRLTNDAGATYFGQTTGTTQPLHGIVSAGEQILWTVGFSGAARTTTNGGSNWTPQNSGTSRNYYAVTKTGINTLFAVGFNGTIIQTSNGGASWATQVSGTTTQLNGVSAVDSNTVWAVGENGTILNTVNGGTSWAPQSSGTAQHLNAVIALNSTLAWAVGNGGTILKWNGTAWAPQTSGTASNLMGVTAVDANTLWAVGAGGTLLKTTNGGANWTPQASGTTRNLNAVSAFDAANAWAVGDNGAIVATSNGINWFVETSPTLNDWFAVNAIGVGKAFASGSNGSVIRSFTPINPPVVVTRPATNITGDGAYLNASITPNGSPTTAYIEYGPGASGPYTNTAPLVLTPNDGPVGQTVSAIVTGLDARSTYHYRAVAENIAGITTGQDVVFNTVNSVPVPTLLSASTNEDVAKDLTLTATDDDQDPVTFEVTEGPAPAAGTLSPIMGGNQVTFTPTPNYNGPATFKYRASDAFGGVSPEQTVTITVIPVNDPPTVTVDTPNLTGDTNELFTNTGTWADIDGDVVTLTASLGTIIKNGDGTWSWSYTPLAPIATTVTITAKDPSLAEATATFTISAAIPANIAVSQGLTAVPDNVEGLPIPLLTTTVGDSRVTVFTVTNSGEGTLSISAIGITGSPMLTITDAAGDPLVFPLTVPPLGTGSFGVLFSPTADTLQTAQVNITNNAPGALSPYTFNVSVRANRAPIAVDDTLTLTALAATEATDLLTNDSDPDGGAPFIVSYTQGASGTVTMGLGGNLVYTPAPFYIGYDEFTYTIADSEGATDSATVVVNGAINPPPVGPGNYAALLRDTLGNVQGLVFYKFSGTGGASGHLRIGRVIRRFGGPSTGGAGTFNATAKNNPTMTVNITIGLNGAGNQALLFSVNAGALVGDSTKSPYAKGTPPPRVGRYIVLAANDSVEPAVASCLSFRVAADGLVSWKGKNGAGYNVTGSSVLLTAGVTPYYSGRTGTGTNSQSSNVIITVPAVYGTIHWDFVGPDARIASAFEQDYPITGEAYTPPVNAAGLLGQPNVSLTLNLPSYDTDADLLSNNPTIRTLNLGVIPVPDNLPVTKMRFDLALGFYTGKANVKGFAPRAFFGVILPGAGYGRGPVMDVNAIGSSFIEPQLLE